MSPPACPRSLFADGDHCFCRAARRDAFVGALSVSIPVPLAVCCACGATREVSA